MRSSSADRSRRELMQACHKAVDVVGFFEKAGRALKKAVDYDGCCWMTLDPATFLPTSHIAHNSIRPEDVPRLARNEFFEEDVNKLAVLARAEQRSGILSEATGGKPETSPRLRDLLRPNGFEAELRASFVDGSGAWGAMAMYRKPDKPDFDVSERIFVAELSRLMAEGVRRAILFAATAKDEMGDAPGLILLDDGGSVETMTAPAERWLSHLIAPEATDGRLPNVVSSVAYKALLAARGGTDSVARARVPTTTGRWLVLHGSVIGEASEGRTAVIIEPAQAPEIAPLIVEAYGLSAREKEIIQLGVRGFSTKEIAQTLHISTYTVQDHLKSIFDKVGVRSRRELVGHVFFQHYAPQMGAADNLASDGWFVNQES